MEKLYIISVDDQREVLDAIAQDLNAFRSGFEVEVCESADEALELMSEIDTQGDRVAVLLSDHVMPGTTGVEFLTKVNNDRRFRSTKKVLLTGLATHEDTIEAINRAAIDRYIEKPWTKDGMTQVLKSLITAFLLEQGIPFEPYRPFLDAQLLMEHLSTHA